MKLAGKLTRSTHKPGFVRDPTSAVLLGDPGATAASSGGNAFISSGVIMTTPVGNCARAIPIGITTSSASPATLDEDKYTIVIPLLFEAICRQASK
jgi:hypothetical protein